MNKETKTKKPASMGWQGLTYRPERAEKSVLYRKLFAFMKENPELRFANVVDMALASLFSPISEQCRKLLEADMIRFTPEFEPVRDDNEKNTRRKN